MSPYQRVCTNFLDYLDKKTTTLPGLTYLILFTKIFISDLGDDVIEVFSNPCNVAPTTSSPIPTFNQWGLLLFGLLVMNLSLVFIHKQQEASLL